MQPEHPEMTPEDRKLVLLLDFLTKARSLGVPLTVPDLEALLPAFGISLFGAEHRILVLADHEALADQGIAPDRDQLVSDYPCWKQDIDLEFQMREITRQARLGHRPGGAANS